MQVQQMYVATDGSMFNNPDECVRYEKTLKPVDYEEKQRRFDALQYQLDKINAATYRLHQDMSQFEADYEGCVLFINEDTCCIEEMSMDEFDWCSCDECESCMTCMMNQ